MTKYNKKPKEKFHPRCFLLNVAITIEEKHRRNEVVAVRPRCQSLFWGLGGLFLFLFFNFI